MATTEAFLPKDIAAEKGLVNVQIDGTWIQVPKGTRMIEACKIAKQEVPHYCYHPKLSSPGNCRMCLVQMGMPPRLAPGQEPEYNEEGFQEIGWMPRPVISCANTVAENMGIRTQGELVEGLRKGVMEFLLINHPLDCPICDQAGECSLQEFSVEHGKGQSRFKEDKVKKPKNVDLGLNVNLDDERCIMCSRCIRFMDEVANDPVLGFTDRGTHTKLSCHPNKRLDSNYSMNTVDLCPVGALTSKDFRFQMRTWFLKQTPTIDTNCGTGVNITVWSRNNKIYRITPRRNDHVNSEWMPDSYRLAFHKTENLLRPESPLIRQEQEMTSASWDDFYTVFSKTLSSLEADKTVFILSGNLTNEELFIFKKITDTLGCSHVAFIPHTSESDDMLISEDKNSNTNGIKLIFGLDDPYDNYSNILQKIEDRDVSHVFLHSENSSSEELSSLTESLTKNKKIHLYSNAIDFDSSVTNHSEIFIPALTSYEKSGTIVNTTGRIQRLKKAIDAPNHSQEEWNILYTLFLRISGEERQFHSEEDVFKSLVDSISSFKELSYDKIGKLGATILDTGVEIPLLKRERAQIDNNEIVG